MTTVRSAREDDALTVRRILDAAMLQIGDVEGAVEHGDVLVAVDNGGSGENREDAVDERVLGALVLDSTPYSNSEPTTSTPESTANSTSEVAECATGEPVTTTDISAIAVRRRQRDRGVGTALVEAALDREDRLTARFDEDVLTFYESLGFEIEPIADGRYEGELTG